MSYLDIRDIGIEDVAERNYDICIFATGYEKRARYLVSKVYNSILKDISTKLCFVFDDYQEIGERKSNDAVFSRNSFDCLDVDSFRYGEISQRLIEICTEKKNDGDTLKILVDYSVMRRGWYSEILQFLNLMSEKGKTVLSTFVYTCGRYCGTKELKRVDDYILLPGFEGVGSQSKEKYGVFALGYEPISMQILYDWVEPSGVICLVSAPGCMDGSEKKCLQINKNFINEYADEVMSMSVYNVRHYCDCVFDIIKEKSSKYDIVLFGGGPKPFVLGNLLCGLLRSEVSNICLKGAESKPINVESTGRFVVTDVIFKP